MRFAAVALAAFLLAATAVLADEPTFTSATGPSPSPLPSVSPTPTPTPSKAPTPTPSPFPTALDPDATPFLFPPSPSPPAATPVFDCSPEGKTRDCLAPNACRGWQECTVGKWQACVRIDSCCGVNCDDSDPQTADSCQEGRCQYFHLKGTPAAAPSPSAHVPAQRPAWTAQDIEAAIAQLPPGPEVEALSKLLARAKQLESEGNAEEAGRTWAEISSRLNALLEKSKESEYQSLAFAGVMIALIIGVAVYVSLYGRRKRNAAAVPKPQQPAGIARLRQINAERAELVKRFMKREIDYPSYSKLVGSLDSESLRLRGELAERK